MKGRFKMGMPSKFSLILFQFVFPNKNGQRTQGYCFITRSLIGYHSNFNRKKYINIYYIIIFLFISFCISVAVVFASTAEQINKYVIKT